MKTRKRAILILFLALAVVACLPLPNLAFALRLVLVLRALASGAAGENLQVQQTAVQRRMQGRQVEALVYRPTAYSPSRALVFIAGISELGCYHPRLMALCRYLADKGFLVVAPDIREFRQFEVSAKPIDQIVYWVQQVHSLDAGRQIRSVGIAGISFSATLSLIAVARPEIRGDIGFFLGIGPYYDLHRCYRVWFARGPVTVGGGYYPTRFYAKWIIMNAALGLLSSAQDRSIVHDVLIDLLLQRNVPPPDPNLTPQGRQWYALAVMRENQSDDQLSKEISDYLTPVLFKQLDPASVATEIRCPVFLVHGAYDDLIPAEESRELKRHITGAPCHLLISPFLTHTHPLDKPFTWKEKAFAAAASLPFFYEFARVVR